MIYAATSTRDALRAIKPLFEIRHSIDLVFNFGASGDLATQIIAAGKADVFLSADEAEMDRVFQAGMGAEASRVDLLSNQLAIIESSDRTSLFESPFRPETLLSPRIRRLSLGNVRTVPSGRYAKAWLETWGIWDEIESKVLPGVDVRAALAAVAMGGSEVGIVYRTDTIKSSKVRVVHLVPENEGPPIRYPVAGMKGRPSPESARILIDFLRGSEAEACFRDQGFGLIGAEKPAPK